MSDIDILPYVETKDMWQILGLVALGHTPLHVYQNPEKQNGVELVWRFPADASPTYDKIMNGQPLLVDFHRMVYASMIFKQYLQRFRLSVSGS